MARFTGRSLHRPPGHLGNLGLVGVRPQARLTDGSVSCDHFLLRGPAYWAQRGEGPQRAPAPQAELVCSPSSALRDAGVPSPGWAGEVCWGAHSCPPKKLTPASSSRESGMIWLAGWGLFKAPPRPDSKVPPDQDCWSWGPSPSPSCRGWSWRFGCAQRAWGAPDFPGRPEKTGSGSARSPPCSSAGRWVPEAWGGLSVTTTGLLPALAS